MERRREGREGEEGRGGEGRTGKVREEGRAEERESSVGTHSRALCGLQELCYLGRLLQQPLVHARQQEARLWVARQPCGARLCPHGTHGDV